MRYQAGQKVVCVTGQYKTVKDFELCTVTFSNGNQIRLDGKGACWFDSKNFFKWEDDIELSK